MTTPPDYESLYTNEFAPKRAPRERVTTITQRTGFSADLWETIAPTFGAIVSHPFLIGIADGSLPPERFIYFVEQDRLYLRAFSRALSFAAGHAVVPADTALLTGSAATAIAVEEGMHVELLSGFGVDPEDMEPAELSPNGELYVQTILAKARGAPSPRRSPRSWPASGSTPRWARS